MNPIVLLALLALMLTACKRHAAGSPASQSASAGAQPASETPGPPKEAPTETVVVPEGPDMSATLGELSQQLRVYVSRTRSAPKDFEDFIARAHVQVPPPPAGQKYAISAGKVVLVKQ